MDRTKPSAFDRREPLVTGLSSGTLLVDAAYQQFRLDYAAAERPMASGASHTGAGQAPLNGEHAYPVPKPAAVPSEMLFFELSFADRVRLTSTRSAGGDWNWRLCAANGAVLAHGGGYRTEGECRSAIALVQRAAGQAPIKDR
jgi:uncharacterized protein YegP (UPF0339 family)